MISSQYFIHLKNCSSELIFVLATTECWKNFHETEIERVKASPQSSVMDLARVNKCSQATRDTVLNFVKHNDWCSAL